MKLEGGIDRVLAMVKWHLAIEHMRLRSSIRLLISSMFSGNQTGFPEVVFGFEDEKLF